MTSDVAIPTPASAVNPDKPRAPTLYLIIAIKLGKGLLFLLLALGVFRLAEGDVSEEFDRLVRFVRLDPESHVFALLGGMLAQVTPANLRWLASGSLLYGLLSLLEGVGLILRLQWVGWLVAAESALLIPYEMFKLASDFSLLLVAILGLNVMIVWYLVQNRHRLFRHH